MTHTVFAVPFSIISTKFKMPESTLDKETVLKIASLAKLELSDSDIEKYQQDLSGILSLAQQMKNCDTDGIEVMTHPMDAKLRLREDAVTETNQREALQTIAPKSEQGLYQVPKVID